jgi:hypothetical protein
MVRPELDLCKSRLVGDFVDFGQQQNRKCKQEKVINLRQFQEGFYLLYIPEKASEKDKPIPTLINAVTCRRYMDGFVCV